MKETTRLKGARDRIAVGDSCNAENQRQSGEKIKRMGDISGLRFERGRKIPDGPAGRDDSA